MSIESSIANISMSLSSAKLAQEVSLAMTKKVMDIQEASAANLINTMNPPAPPQSGFHARA